MTDDFLPGRRSTRSAERDAVDGSHEPGGSVHLRGDEPDEAANEAEKGPGQGDAEKGTEHAGVFEDFGFETMHGGYSLVLSAIAAMVLAVVNLVEPGHMQLEHVFGGLLGYFIGVLACFALDRRLHRRKRAIPALDPFGTGRQALIVVAIVFCVLGGEAGLAGWIALSALVLGSMADGAWLSLVAVRHGVGLWGALRALQASAPTSQERHWAALFGEKRR